MAEPPIPEGPEDLTPDWLTAALRTAMAIGRAEVAAMEHETIGVGQGFVSALFRLRLLYGPDEAAAPSTRIGS